MKYSEMLKEIKNKKQTTYTEIAKLLGVSSGCIHFWLIGETHPKGEKAKLIEDLYSKTMFGAPLGLKFGDEGKVKKTRESGKWRDVDAKDGTLSIHILDKKLVVKIKLYCEAHNINKTKFLTDLAREKMDAWVKQIKNVQ